MNTVRQLGTRNMGSIIVNKRNLLAATAQSFRMCIVIWLDLFSGLGRQKKILVDVIFTSVLVIV